jgi:hypothetical protein
MAIIIAVICDSDDDDAALQVLLDTGLELTPRFRKMCILAP